MCSTIAAQSVVPLSSSERAINFQKASMRFPKLFCSAGVYIRRSRSSVTPLYKQITNHSTVYAATFEINEFFNLKVWTAFPKSKLSIISGPLRFSGDFFYFAGADTRRARNWGCSAKYWQ